MIEKGTAGRFQTYSRQKPRLLGKCPVYPCDCVLILTGTKISSANPHFEIVIERIQGAEPHGSEKRRYGRLSLIYKRVNPSACHPSVGRITIQCQRTIDSSSAER